MVLGLIKTLVGSSNDRLLKQYRKVVSKVNSLESDLQALDDEALKAKTAEFKERVAGGESLDDLAPEAFAVVREASVRVMKMRHFDVQIMGALALHQGKIAEMGTGEGKTLTATLAVYLNALSGKGVHVVTVNDYLAERDAEWMAKIYNFLGLSVGTNLSQMDHEAKQKAYAVTQEQKLKAAADKSNRAEVKARNDETAASVQTQRKKKTIGFKARLLKRCKNIAAGQCDEDERDYIEESVQTELTFDIECI
jgi:hypothetical protein